MTSALIQLEILQPSLLFSREINTKCPKVVLGRGSDTSCIVVALTVPNIYNYFNNIFFLFENVGGAGVTGNSITQTWRMSLYPIEVPCNLI